MENKKTKFFHKYAKELYDAQCMIPLYVHTNILVDNKAYKKGDEYLYSDHSYESMIALYDGGYIEFFKPSTKENSNLFVVTQAQNPYDITYPIGYAIYSPIIKKLSGHEFRACVLLYTESYQEADFLCNQLNDYLRD
jgi:hypothetical protein